MLVTPEQIGQIGVVTSHCRFEFGRYPLKISAQLPVFLGFHHSGHLHSPILSGERIILK